MPDKKDSKVANLGIILILIIFGIFALMSIMMMFLALGIANEAKQATPVIKYEQEEFVYNDRSYVMLSEGDRVVLAYIDFSDLGVETLKFGHSNSENEKEFGLTCSKEYLSMIDDIENPTLEYTLRYDVWGSKYKFLLDRKEKSILESYEGEIVTPELDYGGQSAYWIGEQLVIRFDDKNLFVLHCDASTSGLFETETCAEFMRTELEMPKRLNAFELLSL